MLGETELLLAPEFFTNWADSRPAAAGLDIQLKRGLSDNELNRYRYDVLIHKAPAPVRSVAAAPTWSWTDCTDCAGLRDQLAARRPAVVRVTDIPQAGVIDDVGSKPRWPRGCRRRRARRGRIRHRSRRRRGTASRR